MKVLWTAGARARPREIEAFIAKESPQVARDMTTRLIRRSMQLEQPPLLDKRLSRSAPADIRELLERPYRLICRVTATQIEIVTLMHYRQLMPSDLAELHSRS